MQLNNKYFIYTATSRGCIAVSQCNEKEKAKYFLPDGNALEITALQWGRNDQEIIVGYKNGIVKLYNTLLEQYVRTLKTPQDKGSVIGLGSLEKYILHTHSTGYCCINYKKKHEVIPLAIDSSSTLNCMIQNESNKNVIGLGGESCDLKLWDLGSKQYIFKAKSLGHDELNLPIRTSIRSITFFPGEDNFIGCATKEGQLLLYDQKAQRRPVLTFVEPKASYTVLKNIYNKKQCVAGTTKGYIQLVDLRNPVKCVKTYKSFAGSVTDIKCDESEPIMVSTSLDRYLRVHNIESKEILHKEYLKQNLTKLLLKPIVKTETEEQPENTVDEYDTLFENMEAITEKKKKKKSCLVANPAYLKKRKLLTP